MSERLSIQFLGLLTDDMVRGKHASGFARRVTKVEIMAEGIPPSGGSLVFNLRVAGVANAQDFSLAAGETYVSTAVTGDGLEVPADSALDVICDTASNAADVTVWLTIETLSVTGSTEEDLGLGMLSQLKAQILNAAIVGSTDYDAVIAAIGKGVAWQFDRYCNRKLARATSTTEEFDAPCDHVVLNRYPIESVSEVALKEDETGGFVAQSGLPITIRKNSGIIHFGLWLGGSDYSVIRVTWTGGYWYDNSDDQSGSLPSGATALPEDIRLAWYQQCREVWDGIDRLGINLAEKPKTQAKVDMVMLTEGVQQMLRPYRRFGS